MINHRFRKTALVLGGSTDLGKRIMGRFTRVIYKRWNVLNIDKVSNSDASKNFILDWSDPESYSQKSTDKIHQEMLDMSPEFDAIINLAGIDEAYSAKLSSLDIFDEFEKSKATKSNLLTAHIMSKILAPNGYGVFTANLAAFHQSKSTEGKRVSPAEYIQDIHSMKQVLDLGADREMENIVHQNANINVVLLDHEDLIKDKDKFGDAKLFKIKERKQDHIANMLKKWSGGDARPENGAFVGFDTTQSKRGKIVLPVFY